jgi:hypothetical protein
MVKLLKKRDLNHEFSVFLVRYGEDVDSPIMFEIQIEPERLINKDGDPCWIALTEVESHKLYKALHTHFCGELS